MVSSSLTICLFGPMRVRVGDEPLPRMRTRSIEWLLALLILRHGSTVNRSWLAGTLWPDSEERQAQQNLRHDLVSLRKALGTERGRIESPARDALTLDLAGADVDVLRFDRAVRSRDEEALRSAVEIYSGPLLEGCQEEWVFQERQIREHACIEALETLAGYAEQRADYALALGFLRRAESMDSLSDSIQRRLMRVLVVSGNVPAALLAYREHRQRLHREMNIEPDEETTRLYQEIRAQARQSAGVQVFRRSGVQEAPVRNTGIREPVTTPAPLPHPITELIGREEAVREVVGQVALSRLVTLVGTGGVGKTRLSLQVAHQVSTEGTQGVAFVALASLSDPALLPSFVASALGIHEEGRGEAEFLFQVLVGWLSAHPVLLVLDNCEHMIDAASALCQTVLESCPNLHILATSRQRLGLAGEVVWRVPSLSSPDPDELPPDDEGSVRHILEYPVVQLFLERARMIDAEFRLASRQESRVVAQICRRLDGIPLAIELAAARVGLLTLDQIAVRLDDRFSLLTGGSRRVLPRHQTLRALIDWSYDLLDEQERALLRHLSLYIGGWTLEAAEAVFAWILTRENRRSQNETAAVPDENILPYWGLDLLALLMDKSLIQAERHGTGLRYRMLESVREYMREKLRGSGMEEETRNHHLTYFLRLAEEIGPALSAPDPEAALALVDSEIGNLRAALAWAHQQSSVPDALLRLAATLWPFWDIRGYASEGRANLRAALNRPGQPVSAERAQALLGAASLATIQFAVEESLTFGMQSLEQFRLLGDRRGTARALLCLGNIYIERRDAASARKVLTEGLELCRQCGWLEGIATALGHLGRVAFGEGDAGISRSLLMEGLAQAEALGNARLTAQLLHNLGYVVLESGDAAHARVLLERVLAIRRALGYKPGTAHALNALGRVAQRQGDYVQALAYHQQASVMYRELGNPAHICNVLYQLGSVYYSLCDYTHACSAFEECLDLFRRLEHVPHLVGVINHLGGTVFHLGDVERARQLHREAMSIYQAEGNAEGIALTLERLAVLESTCGNAREAARLLGSASVRQQEIRTPRLPPDQVDWDHAVVSLRAALGEAEYTRLVSEGTMWTVEQIAAHVLGAAKFPG